MAKYIQNGKMMTVVLGADTPAWTPILVGKKLVVTTSDGKNGQEVECMTKGVFEVAASGAITQGANVTFDNVDKDVTASGAEDDVHAYAFQAAANNLVKICIG